MVGLSYRNQPPPLLRQVGGQRRTKAPSSSPPSQRIPDDDLEYSRPPESSSDEDEKDVGRKDADGIRLGLSDDDNITSPERPSPGVIIKTKFGNKKTNKKPEPEPRRAPTRGNQRRAAEETKREDADLMRIRKTTVKYTCQAKLKHPSDSDVFDSPPKKRSKLQIPAPPPFDSSPEKKPGKLIVPDSYSSPIRQTERNHRSASTRKATSTKSRVENLTGSNARFNRKTIKKEKALEVVVQRKALVLPDPKDNALSEPSASIVSASNKPSLAGSFGSDSPLSTLPSHSDGLSEDELAIDSIKSIFSDPSDGAGDYGRDSTCPICKATVDPDLLAGHSSNPSFRMNFQLQQRFCTAHRTASAKQTWQDRGYPTIDWDELNSRLLRHDAVVLSLLSNSGRVAEESPFVREWAEKVRSGQARTLLQASKAGMVEPGYYGPRGKRHITEFVTRTFRKEIERWSFQNKLVSTNGTVPFLDAVVMPELAVRLIMEDMSVGRGEALRMLDESRDMGELVNDDHGDAVAYDSDDEDMLGGNLQ